MTIEIDAAVTEIAELGVAAYRIPTDGHEADGTIAWDHTTLVCVHAHAGGKIGLGFTYADKATAVLVDQALTRVVQGCDALAIPAAWAAMVHTIRNVGRPGIASMAIS